MARLTIYDRRERALVRLADALLLPLKMVRRIAPFRAFVDPDTSAPTPRRILCLRLERIGDLLMTLPALAELRALAPDAEIDLVVGSWNRDIAGAIPGITRVETANAAWLAREGEGLAVAPLLARARTWRPRQYDLAINFEPDIRSNLALGAAHAARAAGFVSGGGGAVLDVALDYDVTSHTEDNALALVRAALGASSGARPAPALAIPDDRRADAARRLAGLPGARRIGMHVSGGRAIKQWPEDRFREVAGHLVRDRDASIVLTGAPGDRAQVEMVRSALPADRVLDLSAGTDLLTTAAIIQQLDLFVTGDTGPMHLARAVGTPIVAIFGPSDPRRYGPRGVRDVIVRIDLPCSPCNRIRLPPARCTGHTPDCLNGVADGAGARRDRPGAGAPGMIALDIESGSGPRRIDLLDYVEPAQEERAHEEAYQWIKAVRRMRVDGGSFRSRFTYRGDSLWWFAELYLHKEQAILHVLRTLSAFDTLLERERPLAVRHVAGGIPGVIAHAAAARKVRYAGPGWRADVPALARMDLRAVALALAARLSRLRSGRARSSDRASVAAFVHRAFWRSDRGDGSAESYIGPVLSAIESRVTAGQIRYVGIGPTSNFRARRWWDAAGGRARARRRPD